MKNQNQNTALSCEQSKQIRKQANAYIQNFKKEGWKVIIKHYRYIKGQGSKLIRVSKYDKLNNLEFCEKAYGIVWKTADGIITDKDLPLYRNNGGQTRVTVEKDGQFLEAHSNCVKTDQFFTSMGIVKAFEKITKQLQK